MIAATADVRLGEDDPLSSPKAVETALTANGYLPGDGLGVAIYLAHTLGQPLLLEGEAGVGKTGAALAVAGALDAPTIRLQCHEGIDAAQALYDWDYPRQLLAARLAEQGTEVESLFSEQYLIRRPLLEALQTRGRRVLLIDEIDRADSQFEAFLLEVLSENQVTIPELGTIAVKDPPLVVLTSNRTRELHDALKRRCLYHWIEYPPPELERRIVASRVPEAPAETARKVCEAVARLRDEELYKPPGVGETIAWARALLALGEADLDSTLGVALKVREDVQSVRDREVLSGV